MNHEPLGHSSRRKIPYKLYFFDERGYRLSASVVDADDELSAVTLTLDHHGCCELWHGDRIVMCTPDRRAKYS